MAVDDLRTRIAAATVGHADYVSGLTRYCTCGQWSGDSTGTRIDFSRHLADAVIRELGQRRCERCRHYTPVDQFPLPYEGSDQMRPFCIPCTDYIEWATS